MSVKTDFLASYSATDYKRECAILAAWKKWAKRYEQPNGWTVIPAGVKPRGKAAQADNAMRSRVERYRLYTETPFEFVAYIGKPMSNGMGLERQLGQTYAVTTWTGDVICYATLGSSWRTYSRYGSNNRQYQFYCLLNGREYTGRNAGVGMAIRFKETAQSRKGWRWNSSTGRMCPPTE